MSGLEFEDDAMEIVSAAVKAKAWIFEAETVKIWHQGLARPPGLHHCPVPEELIDSFKDELPHVA